VDLPEPDLGLTLGRGVEVDRYRHQPESDRALPHRPGHAYRGRNRHATDTALRLWALRDHDAAAAGALGAIERGGGGAEQRLGLVAVGGKRGDAAGEAGRGDGLLAMLHVELRGRVTQLLDATQAVLGGG